MKQIIYLQEFSDVEKTVLINLKKNLEQKFRDLNIKVEILQGNLKLRKSQYDVNRDQYKAAKILKNLSKIAEKKQYFRLLGVLDNDIYSKNYNFIFGLARRGGSAALISVTRLREAFYKNSGVLYKKQEIAEVIEQRILKEAIHELGHTFTLKHCKNSCIMLFSNSLKDTDNKPEDFCEKCLKQLNEFISRVDSSL